VQLSARRLRLLKGRDHLAAPLLSHGAAHGALSSLLERGSCDVASASAERVRFGELPVRPVMAGRPRSIGDLSALR
jgi:hypothetical protein